MFDRIPVLSLPLHLIFLFEGTAIQLNFTKTDINKYTKENYSEQNINIVKSKTYENIPRTIVKLH